MFFCLFPFEGTFTSFFKDKKCKRSHKTAGIKVFCLMTVGFRSGFVSGSGTLGKSLVFFKLPNYSNLLKISHHACWRTNSSFWPATEHAAGSPVPLLPLILQHIFVRPTVSIVPQGGAGGPNTRNQLIGYAPSSVYSTPFSANFYAWRRPPTAVPGPGIARRIISTFWQCRRRLLLRFVGGTDKLCRRLKNAADRFGVTGRLS